MDYLVDMNKVIERLKVTRLLATNEMLRTALIYLMQHSVPKITLSANPELHARWVVMDKYYPMMCTNCHFEYCTEEDDKYVPKYCPECGARMSNTVEYTYK